MTIFIMTSILIFLSAFSQDNSLLKNRYISYALVCVLIFLVIIYIPSFDIFFSDLQRYVNQLRLISTMSITETLLIDSEPLFLLLQWIISRVTSDGVIYVIITFIFFVGIVLLALRNLFLKGQLIFVFFLYFTFPFFFSYIFNGTRQGLAMVFILLAVSIWIKYKKKSILISLLIAASLFHYSAIVVAVLIYMITQFDINYKYLLILWVSSAILYITNLNSMLLSFNFINSISYVESYTSSEVIEHFGESNKASFLIFSFIFLVIPLYFFSKTSLSYNQKNNFLLIYKIYVLLNSYFLMFGFIAYSNRLATYSWFLIPLLLMYPLLNDKREFGHTWVVVMILTHILVSFLYSPFIVYK